MQGFQRNEKVRISLRPKDPDKSPKFVASMDEYKGKVVTISHYIGDNDYNIKEDGGMHKWAGRWFEKIHANIIEMEEDVMTLFRNNGKMFKPERRVSIADFTNKLKAQHEKKTDMSTPLLPPNTKYYARDKDVEVYVIELSPQTRTILWPSKKKRKIVGVPYNLAFPYVIFVCVFVKNNLVFSEGETPKCFYRTAQIISPKDRLFHTSLFNVSCETNGLFSITGLSGNGTGIQAQIDRMIRSFWGNEPNGKPKKNSDFLFSAKADERVASAGAWQEETSANPLFAFKLPWLESGHTVQSVVKESLNKFSGLANMAEEVRHVNQIAEIAKSLKGVEYA